LGVAEALGEGGEDGRGRGRREGWFGLAGGPPGFPVPDLLVGEERAVAVGVPGAEASDALGEDARRGRFESAQVDLPFSVVVTC